MKLPLRVRRTACSVLLAIVFCCEAARAAATDRPTDVVALTRAFIGSYVSSDPATITRYVASNATFYGSDRAEVFTGAGAISVMLRDDRRLWRGSARLGPMRNLSVQRSHDLCAVFFDAPFSVAKQPAVTVRFAIVWNRAGGRWKVVQSSSVVPTQAQPTAGPIK